MGPVLTAAVFVGYLSTTSIKWSSYWKLVGITLLGSLLWKYILIPGRIHAFVLGIGLAAIAGLLYNWHDYHNMLLIAIIFLTVVYASWSRYLTDLRGRLPRMLLASSLLGLCLFNSFSASWMEVAPLYIYDLDFIDWGTILLPEFRDPFDVLGVQHNATVDEITASFWEKTTQLHPGTLESDRLHRNISTPEYVNYTVDWLEAREAVDVLLDEEKRADILIGENVTRGLTLMLDVILHDSKLYQDMPTLWALDAYIVLPDADERLDNVLLPYKYSFGVSAVPADKSWIEHELFKRDSVRKRILDRYNFPSSDCVDKNGTLLPSRTPKCSGVSWLSEKRARLQHEHKMGAPRRSQMLERGLHKYLYQSLLQNRFMEF